MGEEKGRRQRGKANETLLDSWREHSYLSRQIGAKREQRKILASGWHSLANKGSQLVDCWIASGMVS